MKKADFLDLIENNQGIIHKICRLYSNQEDYQDLYQDILISLWNGIDRFKGGAKPSTWVYKVALYTALNHRRYASHRKFSKLESDVPGDSNQHASEAGEIIMTALRSLNPDERALMILYLEEQSYQEIGEMLGISVSNVGVRINRIKKKLKRIISAENG